MNFCIMWSRIDCSKLGKWKGGRNHLQNFGKRRFLKIILALCKRIEKNKNSPELIGSGLWRACVT